ncbi:MAG TPA: transcriptional regulator [Chitinophagales bacterium]|nr:transcriptional regulator [Chitinophagales bacterium]
MQIKDAKKQFVQGWGALGSQWGINKTLAQIHALMMVSTEPLSTEEIMEELSISRGNANMNIRELTDWGLVSKVFKPGERRDYFVGEKEVWKIARQVAKVRKAKELDPILNLFSTLKELDFPVKNEDTKQFQKLVNDVHKLALSVDKLLEVIFKAEENWFWDKMLKLFTK